MQSTLSLSLLYSTDAEFIVFYSLWLAGMFIWPHQTACRLLKWKMLIHLPPVCWWMAHLFLFSPRPTGKAKSDTISETGEPTKQTLAEVNRFLRKLLLVLPRKESASATCFPWIRGNGCHRSQLDSSSSLPSAISPASLSFLTSSSPFKLPPFSPANLSPRDRYNSLAATSINSPGEGGAAIVDSVESFGIHDDVFARQRQQQQQQQQSQEVEQVNSGPSSGVEEDASRSDELTGEEKSRLELMPVSSSDGESLATAASSSSSSSPSSSSSSNHNSYSNSNDRTFPLDVSRNLFQSRIQLTDREPRVYPRVYHPNSRLSLLASNRLKNTISKANSANAVTQSSGKRGLDCIRDCITRAGLHPVQCHSIC